MRLPNWMRRARLALAACAAAIGPGGAAVAAAPNIILIVTDDQRFDAIGALDPAYRTPHLDRLLREGTHFRNAFVTTSLCSPSRASILSGKAVRNHGVFDNNAALPAGLELFPGRLRRAGYRTAFIGKWHMGGDDASPRPDFDHWVSFPGQGNYYPVDLLGRPSLLNVDGREVPQQGYITDELTDYALAWLRQRRAAEPFFMVLSHKAAHAPFQSAPRHLSLYADMAAPQVPPARDDALTPLWLRNQRNSWHGVEFPYHGRWRPAQWRADYARTLSAVDDSLGRLLAWLDTSGRRENTIILFTSDNGFMQGEQGLIDKRTAYESSIRVPMILWGPGHLKPATRDQMVLNIDIAPTLLALAGVEPAADYDGASFAALARGEAAPWRDSFAYEYFWEFNYPHTPTTFAVRTDRYKYIQYQGVWDLEELFDLAADPAESRNLIADPALVELKQRFRQQLYQMLAPRNGARGVPYTLRYNQGAVFRRAAGSPAAAFPPAWLKDEDAVDRLEHFLPDGPGKEAKLPILNRAFGDGVSATPR